MLGEGTFGKVYAGMRIHDSLSVAIKVIKQFSGGKYQFNQHLPTEVSLMDRVSHIRGVIKLIDACYVKTSLVIVM